MMTAKDYRAIAATIQACKPKGEADDGDAEFLRGVRFGRFNALADVVDELMEVFSADNPDFDPARFEKACGF
jgi:hypothetical protein